MFCSKCGKELPNDSVFCNACGQQINASPKAEQVAKEKKTVNKKAVMAAVIISCSVVMVAALVLSAIHVFVPMAKYNSAMKMMERGNYVAAYESLMDQQNYFGFDSDVATECYSSAICQLVEEGKIREAFEVCCDHYYTTIDLTDDALDQLPAENYEQYYNGIVEILNSVDFQLEATHHGDDFVCALLEQIPITYKDVDQLKIFCDDIYAMRAYGDEYYERGYGYVMDNRSLIRSLWDYQAVRQMAMRYLQAFLVGGKWQTQDGSMYLEFTSLNDGSCRYSTNINVPSVEHRYYTFEGTTMIFCNAGDAKVCDVFRFEFDSKDPAVMNVYCYVDGETVTLYRR